MAKFPKDNELEISLFGPGYGEALAIHLGCGNWVLVDSCLEPQSRVPAQLQYLETLGVDIALAVKLVVATHWHDDHVQGMGSLVQACKSATVVVSGALKSEHFEALISLFSGGTFPGSSGVTEFVNVFRILEERRASRARINMPKLAAPDKLLYRSTLRLNGSNHEVEVYSLSPSESSIISADLDFSQRIPVVGQRPKRIVCPTTNDTSVVLWLRIGKHAFLLGSDLERTNDPKTGWTVIINESQAIREKALVYKIAHHGAESSYDPNIWSHLLYDKPYALLSPYMVGNRNLPTEEDLVRVAGLTPNAYITAQPNRRQFRTSDRVVRDTVKSVTKSIQSVNIGWGHVRLRCDIEDDTKYSVELFGNAYNIKAN